MPFIMLWMWLQDALTLRKISAIHGKYSGRAKLIIFQELLELYQENAALFAAHRNDLPPDLIEFVCNHLMTGGDEARLAVVEDFLRGWLIKFTDPDKPESKQQSEDAKARLKLLLAKSYYKGQRYDVARAEYSTVTNRYAGTPHAIEAKFGIGESFMAQKI